MCEFKGDHSECQTLLNFLTANKFTLCFGDMYAFYPTVVRFHSRTCKHFSFLRALLKSADSKSYRRNISIDCLSLNSYQDGQSSICHEFDWDYLCNPDNAYEIKENIRNRKGIGDIDTIHRLWKDVNINLYFTLL